MKKIVIYVIGIIFLSVYYLNTAYAKDEIDLPVGIDIEDEVIFGNTNANISLGGYMCAFKENENDQRGFYAYCNPPLYIGSSNNREITHELKQCLIKHKEGNADLLSHGFNCMCINNYNDEWIFFMKNNDGCIYKVKTDGTKESKLELPFFVRRFLLVNDRLIIETQFSEYGKILSTDLNGDDLRIIAKCDPRCGDMMIQADEKGVYYYDDVNLELKRISYDGKEETLILKGRSVDGAPVTLLQVNNNKIIVRLYNDYSFVRLIILDLDKPINYDEGKNLEYATSYDIGIPFFEYDNLPMANDCYNFSDDGCFVLTSIKPENYILGYDEHSILPDNYYVYKLDLNYIYEINNGTNWHNGITTWKDEVFYEGYVDIMGGNDRDYAVYIVNGAVYLYDPVKYLNIDGLRFYSDHQISYREPDYREPPVE